MGYGPGRTCLFCGGRAIIRNSVRYPSCWYRRIWCDHCGARFTLRDPMPLTKEERRRRNTDSQRRKREKIMTAKAPPPCPAKALDTRAIAIIDSITTPGARARAISSLAAHRHRADGTSRRGC